MMQYPSDNELMLQALANKYQQERDSVSNGLARVTTELEQYKMATSTEAARAMEAEAELARVTAERDRWKSAYATEYENRARVAELESEAKKFPWEEVAKGRRLGAAEQRNAELVSALRKLARPYVEAACDRTYDGAQGHELRKTANERLEAINAALARVESATPVVPRIRITCETRSEGVIGSTDLNVLRVEAEDDGSFTVFTDHWPNESATPAPHADTARLAWAMEHVAEFSDLAYELHGLYTSDAKANEELINVGFDAAMVKAAND